jgi:2-hydroxy-3-oxopropionate reductase
MKVGFVGLGAMGRPMAENLLRAGHELGVWARRQEAAWPLVDQGARFHATPAALARHADAIFVAVTAGADVEQVVLGAEGLIHGARPGSVIVDHSTIAPHRRAVARARYRLPRCAGVRRQRRRTRRHAGHHGRR